MVASVTSPHSPVNQVSQSARLPSCQEADTLPNPPIPQSFISSLEREVIPRVRLRMLLYPDAFIAGNGPHSPGSTATRPNRYLVRIQLKTPVAFGAASALGLCLAIVWAMTLSRFFLSLGLFFGIEASTSEALAFPSTSKQSAAFSVAEL